MGTIPMTQATATAGAQPAAKPAAGTAAPAIATPQTAAANPYIPAPGAGAPGAPNVSVGGATVPASGDPNQTALLKQETDIFGAGVGGELSGLLGSVSGTNSASLQNYVASLQPQMATASANLHATEGAQGVSGNSSVAALGQANLQAQETAAVAGESAQLQQSGQQLEAGILTGQESAAAQEVASSGWSVFGDVLGAVGQDAGSIMQGAAKLAAL